MYSWAWCCRSSPYSFLLALATYNPTDSSLNTASGADAPQVVRNWIGLFGAYLSDLLLQFFGITTFLWPLWLGGLAWSWMRSRSGGSAILRWMGFILASICVPAVLGLLPWHWHWLHTVPVEGVMGRIAAGTLVAYLNIQGAWLGRNRSCLHRSLFRLRHQFLVPQVRIRRPLDQPYGLARSLAELA